MRDLIPMYAVYAVLFADTGLTTTEITSLFVIWSVVAFVVEVPSGAWADTVSRRALLVLSSLLFACCFAAWTFVPSYPSFAVGFVLWGVSSALMSGTFEALLYDELAGLGATHRYATLIGRAEALAMGCNLVATLAAAPLMLLGGYPLVGAASIAAALLQGVLALMLPAAQRVASAQDDTVPGDRSGVGARYLHALTSGLAEVRRRPVVRRGVLLASLLYGLTAFDEYFGLLALEQGVDVVTVPLLVGVTVVGQVLGSVTAGRAARLSARALAWMVAVAAVLMVTGSLLSQPWVSFAALGAGYGLVTNASIVADARLQDAIEGHARATVTSAYGLGSEVVALGVFAVFAVGPVLASVAVTMAAVAVVVLPIAAVLPRWMPVRSARDAPGLTPASPPGSPIGGH